MRFGRCETFGGSREKDRGAGGSRRDAGRGARAAGNRVASAAFRRPGKDREAGSAGGQRGAEYAEKRGCRDSGDAGGGGGKAGRRQVGGINARRRAFEECEGPPGADAAGGGNRMEAAV